MKRKSVHFLKKKCIFLITVTIFALGSEGHSLTWCAYQTISLDVDILVIRTFEVKKFSVLFYIVIYSQYIPLFLYVFC